MIWFSQTTLSKLFLHLAYLLDGSGFTFRVNASVQGWKLLIGIDDPQQRIQVNVINCETTKIEDLVSTQMIVFSQRLFCIGIPNEFLKSDQETRDLKADFVDAR